MEAEAALSTVPATSTSTVGAFLLAHPVGVAVVGGVLVAATTYWLMNKFLKKKEEAPAV